MPTLRRPRLVASAPSSSPHIDDWRNRTIACVLAIVPEYSTYGKKWPSSPGAISNDQDNQDLIDAIVDFIRTAPKSSPKATPGDILLMEYSLSRPLIDNVIIEGNPHWGLGEARSFAIYDCVAGAYGAATASQLLVRGTIERASGHPGRAIGVGDMSYDSTKSSVPALGDSPSWWPLAALAAAGVIVLIFFYGHKTGWT